MNPKLTVDLNSLEITGAKLVFGEIYLLSNVDLSFPGPGWNDFVCVVLEGCLSAIAKLSSAKPQTASFFDGPYQMEFSEIRDGGILIRCEERTISGNVESCRMTAEKAVFTSCLLSESDSVLRQCERLGWSGSSDVKELRTQAALVKRMLKR